MKCIQLDFLMHTLRESLAFPFFGQINQQFDIRNIVLNNTFPSLFIFSAEMILWLMVILVILYKNNA